VSICINSCKVPTQEFFAQDMGMAVTLEPKYDDFSCQFVFGKAPPPQSDDEVFSTPCFTQCPSKRQHARAAQCDGVQPRDGSADGAA
jgi:Beta-carotene isomerase D27-like, C-terminal